LDIDFDVASNPEFLAEGAAVKDFMNPDRIVVGVSCARAREVMERLYQPFILSRRTIIFTDIPSAEMIKYASNSMLATRISFMNDIANLCELLGVNVDMVREGMGSDSRIGGKFLYPGVGYGGSCFPKDVKALIHTAGNAGYDMRVLKAVEEVNDTQKGLLFGKFSRYYGGDIAGKTVALWGLSFKPETDDMREAPSLVLIDLLLRAGCRVRAYDPAAMGEASRRLGDTIHYAADKYDALSGADALMIVTEWKEFRVPDFGLMKANLSRPLIFDGRNIYDLDDMNDRGFEYYSTGRNLGDATTDLL
jgi:UDPglucose 6-dehydrogenase